MIGLYEQTEKQLIRLTEYYRIAPEVTENNRKSISDFLKSCDAKGLSVSRKVNYLQRIKSIIEIIPNKDFKAFTKEDFEKILSYYYKGNYKAWTIDCVKVAIKYFWRYLYELDSRDPLPKHIKWIKRETPPNELKAEDMITKIEFNNMLNSTSNLMYKALLSVLYETGLRPGELMSIKISDVVLNTDLAKIYTAGKMLKKQGKRTAFCKNSYELLKAWINNHPNKNDPDAYLWISKNKPLKNNTLELLIARIGKKAGIKRRIYPYLFRHTFATKVYSKYSNAYARRFTGHAAGSKMEAVYCHLGENDLEALITGKAKPDNDEDMDLKQTEKLDKVTEILNIMATMPEYRKIAEKAVEIYEAQGKF